MVRGTIVLTMFPFTDLSSSKRRPGIVVSPGRNSNGDLIIAFISSVVPENVEPTDYLFTSRHKDFSLTGLKKDSVVKLNKLATLNISVIAGELGIVAADTLLEIDDRLKLALGLQM